MDEAKVEAFIQAKGVTKCPASFSEEMKLLNIERVKTPSLNSWGRRTTQAAAGTKQSGKISVASRKIDWFDRRGELKKLILMEWDVHQISGHFGVCKEVIKRVVRKYHLPDIKKGKRSE